MNRPIKFRGRTENGIWVYGSLELVTYAMNPPTAYIHSFMDWGLNRQTEVVTETVGQFTGLKDKSGKEVYEGDIVKIGDFTYEVYWSKHWFGLKGTGRAGRTIYFSEWKPEKGEVIGNIYENQELIN